VKKWIEMKLVDELELFIRDHGDMVKKALLPASVAFALIFFWVSGGEPELAAEEGPGSEMEVSESSFQNPEGEDGGDGSDYASEGDIYVDIGGEVVNPGVYQVPAGTRLFQVVEQAGGLKDSADTDSINQAERVMDGQKIIIGSREESSPYYTGSRSFGGSAGGERSMAVRETEDGYVVNLNLAELDELQLLPGVGPSTARKILDYREENGPFSKIEDIKNISGIGEKTFENLKEFIEC